MAIRLPFMKKKELVEKLLPPPDPLPVGNARRCKNGHVSTPVCAVCGDKDE
jgi:hypothetical protein